MTKVFISYSSKNRTEKDELVSYLKILESEDSTASVKIGYWDDSKIGIGEEWEKKILDALQEAQIAILLVTTDFLTSEFIMKNELVQILERRQKNDLIVVPVIARHCAWKQAARLSKLEVFNKGQVIWDGKREDVEERLAAVTEEVANCAKRLSSIRPSPDQPGLGVTDGDQKPHEYIQVLDDTTIPKSIPALRETKFTLKFNSDILYSKIHFEVQDNRTTIHIVQTNSGGKESDFEFNFAQGESREQTFTLLPDNPPDTSLFRLKARCFDETGELVAVPVDRLIRLYRQPPLPKDYKDVFGAAIWFWFWFRFSPLYVKTALPLFLLVIPYFVFLPAILRYLNPAPAPPGEYVTKIKDDFLLSRFPWNDIWEVRGGSVNKEIGESRAPDDGALVFNGPGQMFPKIAAKVFYDCDINFRVWFKPPTFKFGWIVRAQPDGKGYVFILERDQNNDLLLLGRIYEGPNKYQPIDNLRRQVKILDCCDASDRLDIDMEVRGNQITCKVTAFNFEKPSDKRGLTIPNSFDRFELGSSPLYQFGNVGLFQEGSDSVAIDSWTITPISRSVEEKRNSPN